MADRPFDDTPRGWRRALRGWLTGSPPPAGASSSPASRQSGNDLPARVAHYAIDRKLGEGGMGVVYAAHDERLERVVALKTMTSPGADDTARQRFWREARAAASVNHPNICHIHDIGEDGDRLYIAMELLQGESLADRLKRGVISVSDAMPIGLDMLAALAALHERGVIHRDLKPSNLFLTRNGVKLLDFGLARPELESARGAADLTQPGIAIGTPGYMAPEQIEGGVVDARCDLFAAGAILFEMLAGRRAFAGRTVIDVLHATVHEQPPALTGSAAVAAIDRVIRRALAKSPAARPISADAMAEELRDAYEILGDSTPTVAHPLTRLVVLPFRVLRPDPETDFLAFSLPDAIATSLSGVGSLVVRSSAVAARFAGEHPDLKALAAEADVDRVVMGTLVRSGDQLRATAQLVETPGGTLLTSHTIQSSFGDLFRLQDDIVRRVVEALSLPLVGDARSPAPDSPRNPRAYELYLRGNDFARTYEGLADARSLYVRALELDSGFAPAWAHLGRCHRVMGKFIDGAADSETQAEAAFQRALAIDPRLSVAHKFYAQLEADMGRGAQAVVRLLQQARRHGNDPELFAGLVHACRYCGLCDESIAADREARRLDPNVFTSLTQTLLMTGDVERLLTLERAPVDAGADEGLRAIGLGLAGRRDEARKILIAMRQKPRIPVLQSWAEYLIAWIEGRGADMRGILAGIAALKIQADPEAIFLEGWTLCDAGEHEAGLGCLQRAVGSGYHAYPALATSAQFDTLRRDARFTALLAEAQRGRERAMEAFREAGGYRLLGT